MRRGYALFFVLLFITIIAANTPISFAATIDKDTTWFDPYNIQDNYEISTEAQLIGLSSLVNEEQNGSWKPSRVESFEGVTFTLTDDIHLTQPWTPIGIDKSVNFAGIFDGDGHTISGIDVKNSYGGSGLFGYLSGEVRRLTVRGKNISYDSCSGGITGILSESGKIISCTSAVSVKGLDKCGGIAGDNEGGTIEDCINTGSITGTYKIGGIVGENWGGKVTGCSNTGKIKSTRRGVATYGTGGIAGRSVSGNSEITDCCNSGEIHSNTEATGGVIGYMNAVGASLKNSYNTGQITIDIKSSDKEMSPAYVGGIVGIAGTKGVIIRNCYNTGNVKNPDVSGEIIGRYRNINENVSDEQYIINNYYTAKAFASGVGLIDDHKDEYADRASSGVSSAKMYTMMKNVFPTYAAEDSAENSIRDLIPDETREYFDTYLAEAANKKKLGQILIDILSPKNVTTKVLKEKDKERNEQQQNEHPTY